MGVLEILRSAVWFVLLLALLGYTPKSIGRSRRVAAIVAALCVIAVVATLYPELVSVARPELIGILACLALALTGIVLVEQIFHNVPPQRRWGIKFLCLGLGGMFAFDFYLYSDALMFRQIDPDIWAARGIVNAMVVPLLAVAAARNPKWPLNLSISRGILFRSTALLGAAAYLLVMAAAGYYVRYFGGSWGAVLQLTFLFGAVVLLCAMLFSGTLRARVKVFLSKNFFRYHYDYREVWLRFSRTLSEGEPGVQLYERTIEAMAELVESPGGALWLSPEGGAFEQVAQWNTPSVKDKEPRDGSLARFLEGRQWVVNLEGFKGQPDFYDGLEIPVWMRSIPGAWLIVPLIFQERLLGFVILEQSRGKIDLNWEVNDLLKIAGRQAATYLAQLETAKALLVARQFESFNRMSAFVVHDLKNLISQQSLLLANAEKHRHNPTFQDDMVKTVGHSVEKMKRLLHQLRGGHTLGPPVPVALDDLVKEVVAVRSGLKPALRLETRDSAMSVVADRARLQRVIGNLVQNAIEATPPEGQVVVQLSRQNGSAVVAIADTGCGMSEQFVRYRLFKPFESTKAAGMGIGTYEAREYVRALGGRIEVQSQESHGTTFRLELPLGSPGHAPAQGVAVGGHG
jgi:putative PEP-CTERM system histidine kinase